MGFVLIVTKRADIHADLVIRRIRELGGKFLRINGEDILARNSFYFRGPPIEAEVIIDDQHYISRDIRSVWYRRRKEPDLNLSISSIPARHFAQEENAAAFANFLTLLCDRFWVNPMEAAERAKNKMHQLATASSCGLKIPRTIVTNSRGELQLFFHACKGEVIYKPPYKGVIKRKLPRRWPKDIPTRLHPLFYPWFDRRAKKIESVDLSHLSP